MTWLCRAFAGTWHLGLTVSLLVGCWLAAMTGCSCNETTLARLAETQDQVVRDFAKTPYAWQPAPVGSEFALGDAVRTGSSASALLELLPSGRLTVEPETTVRFSNTKQRRGLVLEAGNAVIRSGGGQLELYIGDAFSVLRENSEIQLTRTDQGISFLVKVGQAVLDTTQGELQLSAGQGVEISVGLAVLKRFTAEERSATAKTDETPAATPPAPSNVTVIGKSAQAKRADQDAFEPLPAGQHELHSGTLVKLGAGATATMARSGAQAEVQNGGAFQFVGAAGQWLDLQSGTLKLNTEGPQIGVRAGDAKAHSEGATSAAISNSDKSGLEVKVFSGKIVLDLPNGETEVVGAGETLRIEKGKPANLVGRSLPFSDMRLPAGVGAVIHDPSPPTALGLGWDGCEQAVVQRLKGKTVVASAAGENFASLYFPTGRNDYQILCLGDEGVTDEVVAKGRITVLHDSGTRRLPRTAPRSTVDTDGRRYTVMYQNRLPTITARWPGAPATGPYQLSVSSKTGSRSYTSRKPSYQLPSGRLGEGTHQLSFSAGGQSSPTTSVVVKFDNATPTASIETPKNGSISPGQSVKISGTALRGWSVSAGGKSLKLDADARFSGSASYAGSDRAFTIRFSHPYGGTHYYLRHAAGGS